MNFARDISRLNRYIMLVQAVSLLVSLFGLVSIILFVDPSLIGVPDDQSAWYQGNSVWLVTGAFFIIFAGACIAIAGRWSRRLVWIYRNVTPESMKLSVVVESDSEATSYKAVLRGIAESVEEGPVWRLSLYSPGWDIGRLLGREVSAKVYFDPQSGIPAVIETEDGLLWRMAGGGAAEQLA